MLAYRLLQPQTQPVRVAGSGLCHTDFPVIFRDRDHWGNEQPPFTLGHEVAGWIEEVGSG
jgi:D-arabinose 1-dehydrogenase-like Zn-dependent alcohol dehydrogenase